MKKLTDLINESGAGFWGTTSAKDKLASDTPGQGVKKKKLTDMAVENFNVNLVEMTVSFKFETLQDVVKAERRAMAMGLETSSEKMKGQKVWLLHLTGKYTDITKWLKRTQPEKEVDEELNPTSKTKTISPRDYKIKDHTVRVKPQSGKFHLSIDGKEIGVYSSEKGAMQAASKHIYVGLKEERDDFDSPITSKDIRMAIGIANDPRYKQGNYTAAYQKISRLKKDLQKHPRVRDALRQANEEHQCEIVDALMEEDGYYKAPLSSYERRFARTPEGRRDAYGDRGRAMEKIAEIKDKIQRAQERARKFEKLASAAQGNEKFGAHTGNEWRQKAQEKKKDIQKYQRQISNLQAGRHINDGITENFDFVDALLDEGAVAVSTVEKEIRSNGGKIIRPETDDKKITFTYNGGKRTVPVDRGFVQDRYYMQLQKTFEEVEINEATLAARNGQVIDHMLSLLKTKLMKDMEKGNLSDAEVVAKLVKRRIENDTKRKGHARLKNEDSQWGVENRFMRYDSEKLKDMRKKKLNSITALKGQHSTMTALGGKNPRGEEIRELEKDIKMIDAALQSK